MRAKIVFVIMMLFFSFTFSQASAFQATASFRIMNEKNETIANKDVSIAEGDILYEVTKNAFDVEEADGHIISINGVQSVPEESIHWVAFVNGEYIQLSPKEIFLYANDTVVWALRDLDQAEIKK